MSGRSSIGGTLQWVLLNGKETLPRGWHSIKVKRTHVDTLFTASMNTMAVLHGKSLCIATLHPDKNEKRLSPLNRGFVFFYSHLLLGPNAKRPASHHGLSTHDLSDCTNKFTLSMLQGSHFLSLAPPIQSGKQHTVLWMTSALGSSSLW